MASKKRKKNEIYNEMASKKEKLHSYVPVTIQD